MNFYEFLHKVRPDLKMPYPTIYCFDPGETTGYAIFINAELKSHGQLPTKTVRGSIKLIQDMLQHIKPGDKVICEDYKIYSWKTDNHAWASLHTPRLIGAMECLCFLKGITPIFQMAQQPKGFCTDEKLEEWGYYKPGMKHARDAIRHGCYYLLHAYKKDLHDHQKPS